MSLEVINNLNSPFEIFTEHLKEYIKVCDGLNQTFNCSANQNSTTAVVVVLALQCKGFLLGLYKLKTNEKCADSSQLTIARSFLEALIRLDYVSSCGDVARKNLVYTDAKALSVRNKEWNKAFSSTACSTEADKPVIAELKKSGCEELRNFLDILKKCPPRSDGSILREKEIYSLYKNLCAPAHSDLSYLEDKYFREQEQFDQTVFYKQITVFLEALIINLKPWIDVLSSSQASKLAGNTA